jgi:hypothetical protein
MSPDTFKCVGWAKRPDANAFGGVPTTCCEDIPIQKMVGTAQMRFCAPYGLAQKTSVRQKLATACNFILEIERLSHVYGANLDQTGGHPLPFHAL